MATIGANILGYREVKATICSAISFVTSDVPMLSKMPKTSKVMLINPLNNQLSSF
jgi:hypothetical protein